MRKWDEKFTKQKGIKIFFFELNGKRPKKYKNQTANESYMCTVLKEDWSIPNPTS